MIRDLAVNHQMAPVIGLLHGMVVTNHTRLKRIVEGISAEETHYHGAEGTYNSIAQLIRHLTVVDLHWVFRLQSMAVPAEWIQKYGEMFAPDGRLPRVEDISIAALLEEYDQIQLMLHDVCLEMGDTVLEQIIPYENGKQATIRWGIWHIADHTRHHYAQIVHLKQMFRRKDLV